MTNPQLEDGYTKIANELLEALAKIRISGVARQVLDVIIRKTYGFNKTRDRISLTQMQECTELNKQTIIRARNKLVEMNLIGVINNANGNITTYWFNKRYHTWKSLPKKITLSLLPTTVGNNDNQGVALLRRTKETITKETITKENIPFVEIVEYLNKEVGTKYKSSTPKTKSLIKARWNEGFRLDDFKRVIDIKVAEWKEDPYWVKYLRPNTLFGPKFEGYLNQKSDEITPRKQSPAHYEEEGNEREW